MFLATSKFDFAHINNVRLVLVLCFLKHYCRSNSDERDNFGCHDPLYEPSEHSSENLQSGSVCTSGEILWPRVVPDDLCWPCAAFQSLHFLGVTPAAAARRCGRSRRLRSSTIITMRCRTPLWHIWPPTCRSCAKATPSTA